MFFFYIFGYNVKLTLFYNDKFKAIRSLFWYWMGPNSAIYHKRIQRWIRESLCSEGLIEFEMYTVYALSTHKTVSKELSNTLRCFESIPWASCQIRKLRVAHAPGMLGKFSPTPTSKETSSYRYQHASRHVRHARAMGHVAIYNLRWRGKRSRHFYVSDKGPIAAFLICQHSVSLCRFSPTLFQWLSLGLQPGSLRWFWSLSLLFWFAVSWKGKRNTRISPYVL